MSRSRACDACAARKIRCSRTNPCRRCSELSISCTATREKFKPGPKGPWAQKRREALIKELETRVRQSSDEDHAQSVEESEHSSPDDQKDIFPVLLPSSSSSARLPIAVFENYLSMYQQASYSVWPVIDKDVLLSRLSDPADDEAYALAAAVSAVTIAQLKLPPEDPPQAHADFDGAYMAAESARTRFDMDYQEYPSLDSLLCSFFLHVSAANRGQVRKGAMLLREAIACAQLLGLDKASHYDKLTKAEEQLHLRAIWLLFITERGHTTRFDFPRILQLDQNLPKLEVEDNPAILNNFVSLCELFQNFGNAMDGHVSQRTHDYFVAMHSRLQQIRGISGDAADLQKADFLLTQQWMRIVLWKMSMYHIRLPPESTDDGLSLSFPDQVARNIIQNLSILPTHVVEAHGLGMEMKLFEVAMSLADVLLCLPSVPASRQLMHVSPHDVLAQLFHFLTSFRGGGDVTKLQILYNKLQDISPSSVPQSPLLLLDDVPDQDRDPVDQLGLAEYFLPEESI